MLDLKHPALAREPLKEPAKRWRNLWRFYRFNIRPEDGAKQAPGVHWGRKIWPSKELAEQGALRSIALNDSIPGPHPTYLGAFPDPTP